MDIRLAQEKDIGGLIRLLQQVGQVHHEGRPDLFRGGAQKYDETDLAALLKDADRPIFVAVQEDTVLGYCFCMLKRMKDDPVLADHATVYIDDLCVDEVCRGRHVGKALYEYTVAFARTGGFDSVTLNVWAFNDSAMKFYERCGMTPQKIGMEQRLR